MILPIILVPIILYPVTLAVIEAHTPSREALAEYLAAQPEFRCSAVVDSVQALLEALDTGATPPQLLLFSSGRSGRSGVEGLALIRARLPGVPVLMLSVVADAGRVYAALGAGAVGFLLQSTPLPQLKEHLLQMAAGGSPLSPGVARYVVQAFQQLAARPGPRPAPNAQLLTRRELEIMRGIEDGLSYQRIADRCFISLDTVRNHIRAVYRKLHVHSRGELLAHALKQQQQQG